MINELGQIFNLYQLSPINPIRLETFYSNQSIAGPMEMQLGGLITIDAFKIYM